MLSHRAVLAAVAAIGGIGALRLRDHDRALQVLPMYHLAGWVVAFLPLTLVGGASVVPEVGFDSATVGLGVHGGSAQGGDAAAAGRLATESALEAAHTHRVTMVPGAPGFYHHLVGIPGRRAITVLGPVAHLRHRAARTRRLLCREIADGATGLGGLRALRVGLGGHQCAANRPAAPRFGRPAARRVSNCASSDRTVGTRTNRPARSTADDAEPEGHDPLDFVADLPDAGEVGRIVIRGATLFSGYWPDGGGGPGADGWFVTGDIGFLDDAGELHLVDRAAEVVKVSGFTVYPREVEEVLATHPYVAEVAVIGMPGGDGQEQVVAVIVPRHGKHPTPEDLAEFVTELLPAFKRPTSYHLVQALPRTEVGRLDRAIVQRSYARVSAGCRCPGSRRCGGPRRRMIRNRTQSPPTSRTLRRSWPVIWPSSAPGCRAPVVGKTAASRTPTRTCSDGRTASTGSSRRSEAADLLDLTRDLVARELAPRADKSEAAGSFPRELFAQLGELGLLSLPYPEEFGGGGQPAVVYLQVLEELARGWATIALGTSVHVLSCSGVAEFGTADAAGAVPAGDARWRDCWVPTACPNRTPVPMPARCAPRPSGTATSTCITGDKAWITHGPVADFMLVAARTGGDGSARDQHLPGAGYRGRRQRRGAGAQDGLSGLADQRRAVRRRPGGRRSADRRRGSGLPDRHGRARCRPARASRPARSDWPRRRWTSPPTTPAPGRRSGGTIDEFQGVSFLLADAATRIAASRQLYLYAARRKDAGKSFSTEAAMAKLTATDMAMAVTTDMVQVLGGAGYVEDHPLERYMREAKVLQIVEGTNQIQRMVIARSLKTGAPDRDA